MDARSLRSLLLFAFGSFLTTSLAMASPAIPSRLRAHLDLGCTPKCTTCHDSALAGRNNARRVFAQSISLILDEEGLDITSANSIEVAVDALDAIGTDSDGDEIADIDELRRDPPSDPSIAGPNGVGQVCIDPEPTYGCGAHYVASDTANFAAPLVTTLLLGIGFVVRRAGRVRSL